MIGIIDYKMGNIQSVLNAFEFLGAKPRIVKGSSELKDFDKIVLPGVGAFGNGIDKLKQAGFMEALETEVIKNGKFFLGICLGMQLICKESFEFGQFKGLGWIDASVRKFPDMPGLRVPHIGWNSLRLRKPNKLVPESLEGKDVYFVHSFYVEGPEKPYCAVSCDYGIEFTAVIEQGNIFGTQFHPEKSQHTGLQILKNFIEAK